MLTEEANTGEKPRYSFLIPPPPVPEAEILETVCSDLVVVGAGLAGLCAALRGAELGASVTVLEKSDSFSVRGGHIGVANSKAWRAVGVVNDEKDYAREWIAACGNRASEELVWLFIRSSERAMDWLIDHEAAHGITPTLVGARYTGSRYTERYGTLMFTGPKGSSIREAAENIYEDSRRLGADYRFLTPGRYLEKTEGRVTAVIAGAPGAYRRFKARRGVILSTGDIHGDEEMLRAYCPMMLKVTQSQYSPRGCNTGDGHKMGLWVGGVMEDAPLPTVIHPQGYNRMQAFFLFVNIRGERFMNEDTWCQAKSLNVLKQPGNVDYAYSIFDADFRQQMIAGMPYSGGMFNDNASSVYGVPFDGNREQAFVELGLKNGMVVRADTIPELAEKLGIPPETLTATVARYNSFAERGDDADFGKRKELLFPIRKPPFYASKFGPARLAVTGGLLVDRELRVVDGDRMPIPGLYAAGNVAGGLYGVDYPTLIPGTSHGRALTWGFLCAENAMR